MSQETIHVLKEAFYGTFTDDPVNWIKWIIVFAVLIGGYFIAVPLLSKVEYRLSRERKRDIARSRNHIIEANLVDKYYTGEGVDRHWHATYEYTWNGKTKRYRAMFVRDQRPRCRLYLYYVDNPKKLFSCEEYRWENYKGVIFFPLMFLPWMLAILAILLLKIDLPM